MARSCATMPVIACLHTADSNIAVFDEAARGLGGVVLRHIVRADLLEAAEQAGGLTPVIAMQAEAALRDAQAGADAVLLTCSTLGPAADSLASSSVLRVDAALAEAAVQGGGHVVVLIAVATTVVPTRTLFEAAALATGATIEVRMVPDAWARFRAGDREGYHALLADAAALAVRDGAARVVLAQASMAGAVPSALSSPSAGLARAAAAARAQSS